MTKTVGVLGGLGPESTVDFMAKVLAATPATSDQDHIRMLVDHNPAVPNRHDAIAGRTAGVGPQLAAMASGLEQAGADFLVMVCNTAHAWTGDIRAAVDIPFVSIIEVTVEALAGCGAGKVGVMAAEGCLQAGLYQDALLAAGHEPVLWSRTELQHFMELVYRIKGGARGAQESGEMARLAATLVEAGADTIIAGCTEIPLVLAEAPVPLLSSTDLLAHRTVQLAKESP